MIADASCQAMEQTEEAGQSYALGNRVQTNAGLAQPVTHLLPVRSIRLRGILAPAYNASKNSLSHTEQHIQVCHRFSCVTHFLRDDRLLGSEQDRGNSG